jgi:hypothetical protein
VDHFQQLHNLHWTVWASLGFAIGLGALLLAMRLWDAWKGNLPGTMYDIAFQQRVKEQAKSSKRREVYISDADAAGAIATGQVLECCIASISLSVAESFKAGTILSLRPIDLPAAFGWASVEVKEAREDGRQWKLVCRFVRTPPWVTRFCEESAARPAVESAKLGA